jgi:hypothetical protein
MEDVEYIKDFKAHGKTFIFNFNEITCLKNYLESARYLLQRNF